MQGTIERGEEAFEEKAVDRKTSIHKIEKGAYIKEDNQKSAAALFWKGRSKSFRNIPKTV